MFCPDGPAGARVAYFDVATSRTFTERLDTTMTSKRRRAKAHASVQVCLVCSDLDAMWSILVVPLDSSVKQSNPTSRHMAVPAGSLALSWIGKYARPVQRPARRLKTLCARTCLALGASGHGWPGGNPIGLPGLKKNTAYVAGYRSQAIAKQSNFDETNATGQPATRRRPDST